MTSHFNALTEAEQERLSLLLEECGEVIQAIGKIQRHGYESYNPTVPPGQRESNRRSLEREIGDLKHAIDRIEFADLDGPRISRQRTSKATKVLPYLHHQKEGS